MKINKLEKKMDTYKTKTKVKSNHKIQIENVPFDDGQEVEIIVSKKTDTENPENLKDKLKGSVLKYTAPFEPAIDSDDWEMLK